jgi:hypothetical protein
LRRTPDILHFVSKNYPVTPNVWSVRVSAQYRAVGQRSGDEIVWVWIGSHNDFDKLFG